MESSLLPTSIKLLVNNCLLKRKSNDNTTVSTNWLKLATKQ